MSKHTSATLPPALLESDAFLVLNAEQRQSLIEKLNYCDEIATRAADAAKDQASDLGVAVDENEVDALSIVSDFAEVHSALSVYLVHSSWTSECDRAAMAQHIAPNVVDALQAPPVTANAPGENVRAWLGVWAKALRTTLERFGSSSSFTEAVTHLIMIDALLCAYLAFAAAARLNCNIYPR